MKINKKQLLEWINALYSGEYKQIKARLNNAQSPNHKAGYCCLGVGCKLFIPEDKLHFDSLGRILGILPADQMYAPAWLKKINYDFNMRTGTALIELNDGDDQYTFEEIGMLLQLVYVHKMLD
jgi:hypothetical protein